MLDEIKIKEEITEIRRKMDNIKDNIISEKRAMTDGEQEELDALRKQINEKNEEIKALREKIDEEGKKMEKEEKMKECDDDKDDKEMKSCGGEDTKKEENKRNKNINVNKMNKLQYRFKQAVENREYNRDIKLDKRSITVTGGTGMHDALIQEDFTEILEPLYANSILTKLGIQTRRGQVNDVHVPKMSKGTVGFIGEIEPAQATGFEFNYITLRPKRIAAYYDISEQALIQDSIGTFDACQKNLVRKVEEYIEQEIFGDTASSDLRPAGIFNGVVTKTITNFKDLCEFEADCEEKNVVGDMRYALSPRAKSYLRQLHKANNNTGMVFEYGEVDGTPAEVSSAVPKYKLVYGNWNNLLFCSWNDGILKISDSATGLITGEVRVYLAAYIDWAVLRPEAFAFGEVAHS